MKALSINQPWAWAILNLGKDIENRSWRTNFRGRFLIHAGKWFDDEAYVRLSVRHGPLQPRHLFDCGYIVGSAVLRDCVQAHESKWFEGRYGFVLTQAKARRSVIPFRGQLGFFEVPDELATDIRMQVEGECG